MKTLSARRRRCWASVLQAQSDMLRAGSLLFEESLRGEPPGVTPSRAERRRRRRSENGVEKSSLSERNTLNQQWTSATLRLGLMVRHFQHC